MLKLRRYHVPCAGLTFLTAGVTIGIEISPFDTMSLACILYGLLVLAFSLGWFYGVLQEFQDLTEIGAVDVAKVDAKHVKVFGPRRALARPSLWSRLRRLNLARWFRRKG